jgi:hypothetical protein
MSALNASEIAGLYNGRLRRIRFASFPETACGRPAGETEVALECS